MTNCELLITRLDRELRSKYQEQSLAAKVNHDDKLVDPRLDEYLRFTQTEGIIRPIQYITLDGLANYFNLYQDDRDRQQILSAMGEEFSQANDRDILVSLQIIQCTYPCLYRVSQAQIDLTQTRAIEHITKIPLAETSTAIQPIEPETIAVPANTGILEEVRVPILETEKYHKYTTVKNIAKRIMMAIGFTIRTLLILSIVITVGLVEGFVRGLINRK